MPKKSIRTSLLNNPDEIPDKVLEVTKVRNPLTHLLETMQQEINLESFRIENTLIYRIRPEILERTQILYKFIIFYKIIKI
jgi:hypothetical protein